MRADFLSFVLFGLENELDFRLWYSCTPALSTIFRQLYHETYVTYVVKLFHMSTYKQELQLDLEPDARRIHRGAGIGDAGAVLVVQDQRWSVVPVGLGSICATSTVFADARQASTSDLARELGLQARLYAHLLAAARRAPRHTSHPRAAPTQMLTAVVHRADDEPIRSMMRG